ncbi:MAG: GntR family transcriptional regulator [Anaerolineae bacterium]
MKVAREIEYALLQRLRAGQYAVGARLPSVRDLAREFGANKNTIASATRNLITQGYLRSVAGKGVYVAEAPGDDAVPQQAHERLREDVTQSVWRAKMVGLSADEVTAILDAVVKSAYSPDHVRLVFVECNEYDATTLGGQIEAEVGVPMRPLLLHNICADPRAIDGVDIVVTTFYHLALLRSVIAERDGKVDVVGVHAPPDADALLRIARAPHGSRVLAVCTEKTTLNTIVNQVRTYNPGLDVETFLVGRDEDLSARLVGIDYAVDTSTSHQALLDVGCAVPVITLSFAVDSQSLEFLRGRIEERFSRRVTPGDGRW